MTIQYFQSNSTICKFLTYWKLKEMVLAVLSESDLTLSNDDVEAIVDKVSDFSTMHKFFSKFHLT